MVLKWLDWSLNRISLAGGGGGGGGRTLGTRLISSYLVFFNQTWEVERIMFQLNWMYNSQYFTLFVIQCGISEDSLLCRRVFFSQIKKKRLLTQATYWVPIWRRNYSQSLLGQLGFTSNRAIIKVGTASSIFILNLESLDRPIRGLLRHLTGFGK